MLVLDTAPSIEETASLAEVAEAMAAEAVEIRPDISLPKSLVAVLAADSAPWMSLFESLAFRSARPLSLNKLVMEEALIDKSVVLTLKI